MDMTIGKCGPVRARVRAPPSKSYTHRALILAALSDGISVITGQLDADDTRITARALSVLGIRITWEQNRITVYGTGGRLHAPSSPIDIGDSGTTMRLMTAVCLIADGPVILTGSERMKERPVGPLVQTLNESGAVIRYLEKSGTPPLLIDGALQGGEMKIDGSISSQYISSLLIASPYAHRDSTIYLQGTPVSEPYITITTDMMSHFGVFADHPDPLTWKIPAGKGYRASTYTVEGDYSSCSYWFALAAITGGEITVEGLHPDSVQGDKKFLSILADMGCVITWNRLKDDTGQYEVTISRPASLKGITVNMADCPDIVQSLAVVAAMADSPTKISGIHHLREKESDRVSAIVNGLRELGIMASSTDDEIIITPGIPRSGTIHPRRDHRTAMCFSILGCMAGDVTILDAGCVTKSYPGFWEVFREIWKTGVSS